MWANNDDDDDDDDGKAQECLRAIEKLNEIVQSSEGESFHSHISLYVFVVVFTVMRKVFNFSLNFLSHPYFSFRNTFIQFETWKYKTRTVFELKSWITRYKFCEFWARHIVWSVIATAPHHNHNTHIENVRLGKFSYLSFTHLFTLNGGSLSLSRKQSL